MRTRAGATKASPTALSERPRTASVTTARARPPRRICAPGGRGRSILSLTTGGSAWTPRDRNARQRSRDIPSFARRPASRRPGLPVGANRLRLLIAAEAIGDLLPGGSRVLHRLRLALLTRQRLLELTIQGVLIGVASVESRSGLRNGHGGDLLQCVHRRRVVRLPDQRVIDGVGVVRVVEATGVTRVPGIHV